MPWYPISKFSSSPEPMFSKLSVVEFVDLRQFGDSNPFFFGHLSKYACGIHLTERFHAWRNVLQNEMHPREWHANINVYPPSMSFYFPDFVSVIVTGWQDFAASLTGKCLSAFLVLSTNYMPHKINRPLYIPQYIESLHHRMTEISFNFINILNPFPNYFTAVVNDWL